ncbi:phosducin family protein [Aspergillus mulundensis]|uniref:Phosducin-like protein n=1 Tax=Aspergillus mulundensis TaxID=1810919 RepID=A0A3D8REB0_9EURO|nr:Phosducin-like protein [Aspergillus mulundensis]RDW72258.1 Phosducin-like protein [Aspergillus mulundensis]
MQVEVDPNEDTEWNDILRKHGIIPEKPQDPEPLIQEALVEAERKAYENRLEDKDLDELDELEDVEDEAFLNQYRQKRLAELSTITQSSVHNQVYGLQKPDFTREVTEASKSCFVCVNLTSSSSNNVESRLLSEIWRRLAAKFGDIKFCEMRGNMCIDGYPDRNTPTILVYKDGEIVKQFVTLMALRGTGTRVEDLENMLIEVGALKESDVRLKKKDDDSEDERPSNFKKASVRRGATVEDDDDWD